jgi:enterochelin esterase-like enzyme
MHGQLVTLQLHAPSLEGNPLGDPAERPLLCWLPPGHEPGAPLPAVYFLHGYTGSVHSWSRFAAFAPTVPERLGDLVEGGAVPPFLAVFVDGWTSLGGSQWVNSTAIGRYRDYLVEDVVPFVERELGAIPLAGARAVVGHSSGGYGALVMGRHHPDVFGHLAAHAPDSGFEYVYLPDFPKAAGALLGTDPHAWLEGALRDARETRLHGGAFPVLNTLAMAAAYSPREGLPLGLELPFEPETCRLRPEVWERWLAHDPARFVPASLEAFARLSTIYLDCGTSDEFQLRWGVRQVVEALHGAGIPVVHEEFDGGHGGNDHRFEASLALLVPRLERG